MCAKHMAEDTTTWVPICCQRVMRHNVFQASDNMLASTLVCTSCGKHLVLQPSSVPIDEHGEGARVLRVLGVSRPSQQLNQSIAAKTDPGGDKTM